MADNYKVSFLFENGKQGWSESYYTVASTDAGALSLAQTLKTYRTPMLAFPAKLTAIRLTNLTTPGPAGITPYFPTNGGYSSGSDLPGTAWRSIQYAADTARQTSIYLRGIPDDVYKSAGVASSDYAIFLAAFNSFRNYMVTPVGFWFIKGKPRKKTGTRIPILTWSISTHQSETELNFSAPSGLVTGDQVTIYNAIDFKPAPGVITVIGPGTLTTAIKVRLTTPVGFSYAGGAYLIKVTPIFKPITSISYGNVTTRATGRPFGVRRGKRPGRPK